MRISTGFWLWASALLFFSHKVWAFAAAVERDPKGMEGLSLDCLSSNSTLEKKREWGGVLMVKMEFSDTLMIGSRLGVIWTLRIFYTIFFSVACCGFDYDLIYYCN